MKITDRILAFALLLTIAIGILTNFSLLNSDHSTSEKEKNTAFEVGTNLLNGFQQAEFLDQTVKSLRISKKRTNDHFTESKCRQARILNSFTIFSKKIQNFPIKFEEADLIYPFNYFW